MSEPVKVASRAAPDRGGEPIKRVVLAYSGGLDTSVILRWLIETYRCEVVAFCADLGQGEELLPVRDKARRTGATSVHVVDLREEFVRDFIFPMLRGAAVYEGAYLLGTSIARPLIAKRQVEIALEEGADAVAHGATGKGNDQVRFELTYAALAPQLRVIAPWREWSLNSRTALLEFARAHDIPVPVTAERPYSMDRNLFHVSYEGGILEDPWAEPPDKMYLLTQSPEAAPDVPVTVELEFEAGDPVGVDGRKLGPVELLTHLNRLGAEHGIGRVDLVENRFVGMKSRGCYETPGGTILVAARRALESITLDREVLHLRDSLVPRYAEMIYYGFWFSPERSALQRLLDECVRDVTGTVRLKLYKGNVLIAGRRSPRSLYRTDFATFEADSVYRQRDAEGFIHLNALRLRIRALRDRRA
ncbi:MAG: argininosuccinate synthase [Candidatus Rokuibacteriota bacterium]